MAIVLLLSDSTLGIKAAAGPTWRTVKESGSKFLLYFFCCCRQARGEMASDGLSSPHPGHQLFIPALSLAGTEVHA